MAIKLQLFKELEVSSYEPFEKISVLGQSWSLYSSMHKWIGRERRPSLLTVERSKFRPPVSFNSACLGPGMSSWRNTLRPKCETSATILLLKCTLFLQRLFLWKKGSSTCLDIEPIVIETFGDDQQWWCGDVMTLRLVMSTALSTWDPFMMTLLTWYFLMTTILSWHYSM